jgi:predicted N-formylglutamate amidohydrolase
MTLLNDGEPAAVIAERENGKSPFLFLCDHAGRRIPQKLGDLGVPEAERRRHIAWDVGIEGVARKLAASFDACLIMQPYSRLVIDCNRRPGSKTSMPTISEATEVPGNVDLGAEDAAMRVREIFDPYHQTITHTLNDRRDAKRETILIALHSFTPVYAGIPRPWHTGVLYNRYPKLALALFELFEAEGDLTVGNNEPYSVSDDTDYTIPVHGEQRGLIHVAIEIRHDLIEDERGQTAWAERLARLLPRAVEAVKMAV